MTGTEPRLAIRTLDPDDRDALEARALDAAQRPICTTRF